MHDSPRRRDLRSIAQKRQRRVQGCRGGFRGGLRVPDGDAGVYYAQKNPGKTKLNLQIVVTKPFFSAKFVLFRLKCPNFFGHFVLDSFVFIHIPALNVFFLICFFAVPPVGSSRKH
jgi:hypothetical protein